MENEKLTLVSNHTRELMNLAPTKLSIFCENGSIEIDLKNGNVKLSENMSINEASIEFWKAVEKAFPNKL